ncbi:MAG: COX15/CtaA family protein [Planctomycetes bacterium]|nr:COX15/CtaA family protein [Planctomycetota bacterium]MCH9727627.1 COX15/CtaA family protein [Planctomycetota bacterium]MCH9777393.1 COX15/CtaA family protein [Planctomycetota bacterium]MCH9792707.1 COX15/CtaA family protein [Planctomycetota bacterium]MDF1742948.1 COX15/CtaA family protein [Gimesia sp.]
MNNQQYHPWLFRLALATTVATLPLMIMGGHVTTEGYGMAVDGWPGSDGQNMFTYPVFGLPTDKFFEHVHRLLGTLVGFLSIILVIVAYKVEQKRWIRNVAIGVLVCVIIQGVLGGTRVTENSKALAMAHGLFGACVFSLMAFLTMITGKRWIAIGNDPPALPAGYGRRLAITVPLLVLFQYFLGGCLRHFHVGLHPHMSFAFVVLIFVIIEFRSARKSGIKWLKRPAMGMLHIGIFQIILGFTAWITKLGLPSQGNVVVAGSWEQSLSRTAHLLVGILFLTTVVLYSVKVFRLHQLNKNLQSDQSLSATDSLPNTEGNV